MPNEMLFLLQANGKGEFLMAWALWGIAGGIILGLSIGLAVWVAKDSRARGLSDSGWVLVVLLGSAVGLVVYLLARPQGAKFECQNCWHPIWDKLSVCPICGNIYKRNAGEVQGRVYCERCFEPMPTHVAECPKCGEPRTKPVRQD